MGQNEHDRDGSCHSDVGINLPSISFSKHNVSHTNSCNEPEVFTVKQSCEDALRRGLVDADTPQAHSLMSRMGYEHVKMYLPAYYVNGKLDHGVSLMEIHRMITFDRRLQTVLLEHIGLFELQLRAQYSYAMSNERGAFAHTNPRNFKDRQHFNAFLKDYDRELNQQLRRNTVVKKQFDLYGNVTLPVAVEIMSFGTLSKLYRNTRSKKVRTSVAASFGAQPDELDSWVRALAAVRNECAHFGVLVCRPLSSRPKRMQNITQYEENAHPFYIVLMLARLLCTSTEVFYDDPTLAYGFRFISSTVDLLHKNEDLALRVKFPKNWYELIASPEICGQPNVFSVERPKGKDATCRLRIISPETGRMITF